MPVRLDRMLKNQRDKGNKKNRSSLTAVAPRVIEKMLHRRGFPDPVPVPRIILQAHDPGSGYIFDILVHQAVGERGECRIMSEEQQVCN